MPAFPLRALPCIATALLASACAMTPMTADPGSDAPERTSPARRDIELPASYDEALGRWRTPLDINDWIGARFEYDLDRAMRLSESQRETGPRVRIPEPRAFFDQPVGVCVDLARFAVETLRATSPGSRAAYLMIEFDPAVIAGNTLRRHWVAQYEVGGRFHFFADSKRPGHLAGPYDTVQAFIEDYSRYRGRRIVSYRTLDSYERQLKKSAPKATRSERSG